MKKYYLAYGSNLNIEQMRYRCPNAKILGTAEIKDYKLLFKGSKTGSYLTIEPEEGSTVPVAVWTVTEQDERNLDRYEGYPDFYYKKEMTVEVTGIRTGAVSHKKAFVYIMDERRKPGIPSPYYLKTCIQGYATFGFPIKCLENAYNISMEESK